MINKRVKINGLTLEQALELEPFPDGFPGKAKHATRQKIKRLNKEEKTGLKTCSCCKEKRTRCFS